MLETQADHDRAGARFAGITVDLSQAHVNVGDALRIFGGLRFFEQRRHLLVRRHDEFEQRRIYLRRFLRDEAHARATAHADRRIRLAHLVADQLQQRRFARAVAADETDFPALGDERIGVLKQRPRADAIGEV